MKPYKCPICGGCGIVPGGFYQVAYQHVEYYTAGNTQETCRACNGTGIVYGKNEVDENLDKH